MSEPLVFVTTHAVGDGAREQIERLAEAFADDVASQDTGLLEFHFHMDQDGREASNVQVHADAASMDAYLPLVRERIVRALALSRTLSIEVFGTPGPVLREVLDHNRQQGVRVTVMPRRLAGFSRRLATAA
ncbi:MAG TPA: hypothetical protein VFG74_08860 [Miltoncostaeaceae bacterium]|jgi:hypothetical protein|nr:hypothetical protein [Miltoncostaeaceae bacterium]